VAGRKGRTVTVFPWSGRASSKGGASMACGAAPRAATYPCLGGSGSNNRIQAGVVRALGGASMVEGAPPPPFHPHPPSPLRLHGRRGWWSVGTMTAEDRGGPSSSPPPRLTHGGALWRRWCATLKPRFLARSHARAASPGRRC
jgi:hypothetical protein